ncbi:Rhomboid family mebrane associated serine protease [Candidatus Nanobsidianus stetteri]|uniref:Rhomboid family mebrane associated serine protease n=1 Tax=Nanobsidianus stetteri TaxID=1294122 RepID=R1E520_NANST|nr:Rhomboid family mebrane associated serine protease [Candidatus Nanobsidianus stetteri]
MNKVYKFLGLPITIWLIIILFIVYIIELMNPSILNLIAFYPHYAIKYPWMFITSIFGDYDLSQLFFDGLALFFLGLLFEYLYGSRDLLILFFLSGIVGNIFFLIQYYNNPLVSGIGSSAAISGILGALGILRPKEKVIIFPIIIPIDMIYAAIFWAIFNLIGIFYPFIPLGFSAHLGGTLFGFLYGYILKKYKRKTSIDNIFDNQERIYL